MPKAEKIIYTDCLHCVIREIMIEDVIHNDQSSPGRQAASCGQAIGDIIGLKDDKGELPMNVDDRYTAAVNAIAMFSVAICKVADLPDHPVEQMIFDAMKLAPKIKVE